MVWAQNEGSELAPCSLGHLIGFAAQSILLYCNCKAVCLASTVASLLAAAVKKRVAQIAIFFLSAAFSTLFT